MSQTEVGLDVTVRSFLKLVAERRLFIVKASRGGRGRKYGYISIPTELVKKLGLGEGARFRIMVGTGYVDYVMDEHGDYTAHRTGNSLRIRFPVSYEGYVVIEPREKGFRVYF